jgi:hypothetical protein
MNLTYITVNKLKNKLNVLNSFIENLYNLFEIAKNIIEFTIPDIMSTSIIAWTKEEEFDTAINMMKIRSFQLLNTVLNYYKHVIEDEKILSTFGSLIKTIVSNLEYVVANKLEYIIKMDKDNENFPDYEYDFIIFQMIMFLSRILSREPLITQFSEFSKQ